MSVLDFAIKEAFLFVFSDGLRGGHKDDEEVFSEACQSSSVFLVLDDLISWHEQLPEYEKTLLR